MLKTEANTASAILLVTLIFGCKGRKHYLDELSPSRWFLGIEWFLRLYRSDILETESWIV